MAIHTLLLSAILVAGPSAVAQQPQPATPDAPQEEKTAQKPRDENAEIEKLITDGLAAWRAGDEQKAADLLQSAVGRIQARAARGLATFLPTEAEGWTFAEPRVDSGAWGSGENAMQWSNAEVQASREGSDQRLRVQITNSPQLFQGMQAMVAAQSQMAPFLKQQGTDIASSTKDGFQVLTIVDEDSANGWIVGKRVAVVVTLDHGKRPALDAAIGWIDLAGLAELDGR